MKSIEDTNREPFIVLSVIKKPNLFPDPYSQVLGISTFPFLKIDIYKKENANKEKNDRYHFFLKALNGHGIVKTSSH